jgi:tetratricopeptide (TPR) repeat protein
VTESLTTDLSRISGSFVIARNTAYAYKGRSVDVRAIGRELNVRYVMEGSVQRAAARMRVNVQLIDAESGAHLWAERFDKPVADIFDMQDEIVAHLARQLDTALVSAEARRAAQLPQPDSIDLYFQGMAWVHKGIDLDSLARAGDFFARALALDPEDVGALIGRAWVEMLLAGAYAASDRTSRLAAARADVSKALRIAPHHALAHLVLGRVEIYANRGLQAIAECERALALDRNLAAAHAAIGLAKVFIGRSEETEGHVREALRISPRDTLAFNWLATAGLAKLYLGNDEEATAWFRRATEIDQSLPNAHFYLAAASPISVGPLRRRLPLLLALQSIRVIPSAAFAPARSATILLFWLSVNVCMKACARREFPRRDRDPPPRHDPRRRRRQYSHRIGEGGKAQPHQRAAAEPLSTMSALRRFATCPEQSRRPRGL